MTPETKTILNNYLPGIETSSTSHVCNSVERKKKSSRARLLQLHLSAMGPVWYGGEFPKQRACAFGVDEEQCFFSSTSLLIILFLAGCRFSGRNLSFSFLGRLTIGTTQLFWGLVAYIVHTERLNAFGCSAIRTNSQNFM